MESVLVIGKDISLPLVTQIAMARSRQTDHISWHAHDGFELLFLLEGATTYEMKDGSTVEVSGGNFLVIPPNTLHRASQNRRTPCVICGVVLAPTPARHRGNTPFTCHDLHEVMRHLQRSAFTVFPFNEALRLVVTRLVSECKVAEAERTNWIRNASFRSLACTTILEAMRQVTQQRLGDSIDFLPAAATAYLHKHHQEPIHILDLVRHLGFSRARVFQLFKASLGLTPNDYLQRVRVKKAQELLAKTRKTVTEIAMDTGFTSSQYFSTVFRRYTGRTPASYREENLLSAPKQNDIK